MITRRRFLWRSTLGATFAGSPRPIEQTREDIRAPVPPSIAELRSMRGQVRPITVEERRARLDKARRLMAEHKLDAILLPGGTSLTYFAGARWGNSERLMAIVLPVRGDDFCVCPAFEEDRARTARTRTTEPNRYPNLAGRRKPIRTGRPRSERPRRSSGRLGIEETSKFVYSDSIASAAPALHLTPATPVTAGCRMIKDSHEVELMRLASQATLKCYEAVFRALMPGMTENEAGGRRLTR